MEPIAKPKWQSELRSQVRIQRVAIRLATDSAAMITTCGASESNEIVT